MVGLETALCLLFIIFPFMFLCIKKTARIRKKSFTKKKNETQESISTTPTPKMTQKAMKNEVRMKNKKKQKDEKTPITVESAVVPTSQTGQKPELLSSSPRKDLSHETQNS